MNSTRELFFHVDGGSSIRQQYKLLHLIGEGATGKIYAAKRIYDSLPVAVKVMQNYKGKMDPFNPQIPLEVSLMHKLYHIKGVIKLVEAYLVQDTLLIVMERIESGMDLQKFIKERGCLTPALTRHIFRELVRIVQECHAAGVIHRDIKPHNIIFNPDINSVRVIDFGSASYFQEFYDDPRGSPTFMPPEMFRHRRCNGVAAETWSLGVTLFYMLSGRYLYENCKQLNELQTKGIPFPMDVPMQCQDLVHDLLKFNWTERISLKKLRLHRYVLHLVLPSCIVKRQARLLANIRANYSSVCSCL